MQKFKVGDPVYHSGLGAGIISRIQQMEVSGNVQDYFIIEMLDENTLMIPTDSDGVERLHPLTSASAISDVMNTSPEELDDDYQVRQREGEKKIQSGDQLQTAEVLRDLSYRQFTEHLTNNDRKMLSDARKRILTILSASGDPDIEDGENTLKAMLDRMTSRWTKKAPDSQA